MRYIDICSGISAPTMAWKPLGWQALCFAEIEAAPRAVLAHHYPDVPLRGDFTEIRGDEYGPVDLVVGGTPCQDYSVAGLRTGLGGERGALTLEYSRLAYRSGARWMVWENVPGVFSLNAGRDFGAILATFSGRHGCVFAPPPWRMAQRRDRRAGRNGMLRTGLARAGRSVFRSSTAPPARVRCRISWRLATCRSGII